MPYAILSAVSAAIIISHALTVFSDGKSAKIAPFVNIDLHLLLIFQLLMMKLSLTVVAIFFVSSLIVYLSLFNLKNRKTKGEEGHEA